MPSLIFDTPFEGMVRGKNAPQKVAALTFRADLMLTVRSLLEERGLTQKGIGELLGIPQSRVSELMCGKLEKLSADVLLGYLEALGYRIQPGYSKATHRKPGDLKVSVVHSGNRT